MWQWVAQIQHRLRWRKLDHAAVGVVQQGNGFHGASWSLPHDDVAEQQFLLTAHDWLTSAFASVASPYGFSRCRVIVALVQQTPRQRTLLWKELLPPVTRPEASQGIQTALDSISRLPRAEYLTASHLELYLMDTGAILRQAHTTLEAEHHHGG